MKELLETLTQDGEIQGVCEAISGLAKDAFDFLIQRRDAAYADAIKPLDSEAESLAQEHASINQAARNLEALLPARARDAQRQADALLLAGKREEAETKITEQREAEAGPESLRERQRGISKRLEAIGEEKKILPGASSRAGMVNSNRSSGPASTGFSLDCSTIRGTKCITFRRPTTWGRLSTNPIVLW